MRTLRNGVFVAAALACVAAQAASGGTPLVPGSYRDASGQLLYVATDVEDDGPIINWLNPDTGEYGVTFQAAADWHLQNTVSEKRFSVQAPEGALGVSLFYTDSKQRAAVILIHGNEEQTRDMGYLIPLFVLNGINVVSYDQRGTGESTGQWRTDGPAQRAVDVDAIYDAAAKESRVDPKRIGLWAFSNGGWTAPLVATARPIAFMLLVGAPAESVTDNICFEVHERVLHAGFDEQSAAAAARTVHAYLDAALGSGSWEQAERLYTAAAAQKWFAQTGLRPGAQFPLAAERVELIRRTTSFDPAAVLTQVTAPTLALFGALDHSVDAAHAAPALQAAFSKAGMRDSTVRVYPKAGHSLVVSDTGYEDQPSLPTRLVPDYAKTVLDWLRKRGFIEPLH